MNQDSQRHPLVITGNHYPFAICLLCVLHPPDGINRLRACEASVRKCPLPLKKKKKLEDFVKNSL